MTTLPSPPPFSATAPDFAPWKKGQAAFFNFGGRGAVPNSADLERVLALPRRPQVALDERSSMAKLYVDVMNARLRRPDWQRTDCACRQIAPNRPCIMSLRAAQAWALYELSHTGGLFGLLATGVGKSGLGILAPLVVPNCKLALGLVPANLVEQLVREYRLWAEHWLVPTLVYGTHLGYPQPGRPTLHVRSYHDLSQPVSTDLLKKLKPDFVFADEADSLKSFSSARTKRFVRQFADEPDTRFAGWTGTPWDKSVLECAHLMAFALREGSPLPLDPAEARIWADALDPNDNPIGEGALHAFRGSTETIHQGFHRRLVETYGVVATQEGSISKPLNIHERKPPPMPLDLVEVLSNVRAKAERPDGEELVDAMEIARVAIEVACGFFYRWRFPKMPRDPATGQLTKESVDRIKDWLAKRKAWRSELRNKLKRNEVGLDSEKLCTNAARRAHAAELARLGWRPKNAASADDEAEVTAEADLPEDLGEGPVWQAESYVPWALVENTIEHESEAVWVSDYLAQDAAAWGRSHRGVIWYKHTTFGERVAKIGGFPLYGGGPSAAERILHETGATTIVCSINAHGRGRDGLQYLYNDQLITVPPSSGRMNEQVLARLHRPGQSKPEVNAWCYLHVDELANAFAAALKRAEFAKDTWGSAQKIWDANCDFREGLIGS